MLAVDAEGAPIPWYTYPAIDFLTQRDFTGKNILEFGGGQSTLWWSARAESVLTIEEDAGWYDQLHNRTGRNVNLRHVPVDRTARTLESVRLVLSANAIQTFDIIIIDGHLREEIVDLAFSCLAKRGALILDNSEGYGFYEAIKRRDCRRIDFFGFAPGVSLRHCTSVVYLDDCFLLMPDIPIPVIELARRDTGCP
jgi:predicted O-methyltransferase YrrM